MNVVLECVRELGTEARWLGKVKVKATEALSFLITGGSGNSTE